MTILVLGLLMALTAVVLFAAWRVARTPAAKGEAILTPQELAQLVELGFFKYVPQAELEIVQGKVARTSWPFWVEETRRFLLTDAEDLAEGGVGRFVRDLRPFLIDRGADPGDVEDIWDVDYRVSWAGREYLVWSADEAARERQADQPGLIWGLSTARAFGLVNLILRTAGSDEQVYAVGGGNDLQAFLLTPELAAFVGNLASTAESGRPYNPEETYPRFGKPRPSFSESSDP